MIHENKVSGKVIVQSVNANILLRALSAEADGEIRPGDALIAIEHDDCSYWPQSRIRSRLSNTRLDVGSYVHITFQRRIPLNIDTAESDTCPIVNDVKLNQSNSNLSHSRTDNRFDDQKPVDNTVDVKSVGSGDESYPSDDANVVGNPEQNVDPDDVRDSVQTNDVSDSTDEDTVHYSPPLYYNIANGSPIRPAVQREYSDDSNYAEVIGDTSPFDTDAGSGLASEPIM